MDIDSWIKSNSWWSGDLGGEVIHVNDLQELLKTHTIVPNEPTESMLDEMIEDRPSKVMYKAMLKASQENNQ